MKIEDYFKYYIQGSDHHLIPKDEFKELFNEMSNWREEAKELKKQLEEANEKIILLQASEPMLNYKKALEENQQKEFINYLENEKDRLARVRNNICEDKFDEVNDILQEYKAIIGGKE